ncbi:GNAT family N-acetyltransferase [Staphylococcus massiliensis]|uniref:Putative acetyltransferase n=1 Tax=Staphylococcus massiliensis S46 TaxID=1229783 RepID=K9AJJ4_9STAP|nr:GNAT family N-acetyltransferase [Staphylococcus massiliensis]EKU47498.1 putative acetyltransferase [Staphylococcus massiliensis S46]MCG3398859.1 GNAT family N-acetyltransferase [Staphylococcus massiliensis]MCG3412273.1 GNAT family N-acetyltransferase [Staphylococcus massiliensis]POA00228.1 N-acetyltransferase [Staphylococcus massiliensis CCUG 55927]
MRIATEKDIKAIMHITDQAKSLMNDDDHSQWDERYPTRDDFMQDIQLENMYVYEMDERVVGYIVIDQNQANWYDRFEWPVNRDGAYVIHRLAVDTSQKGIAQKLISFAIEFALSHNSTVLLTDTLSLNQRAQRLFNKFGFIKVGETVIDDPPYDHKDPFYVYYKILKE